MSCSRKNVATVRNSTDFTTQNIEMAEESKKVRVTKFVDNQEMYDLVEKFYEEQQKWLDESKALSASIVNLQSKWDEERKGLIDSIKHERDRIDQERIKWFEERKELENKIEELVHEKYELELDMKNQEIDRLNEKLE